MTKLTDDRLDEFIRRADPGDLPGLDDSFAPRVRRITNQRWVRNRVVFSAITLIVLSGGIWILSAGDWFASGTAVARPSGSVGGTSDNSSIEKTARQRIQQLNEEYERIQTQLQLVIASRRARQEIDRLRLGQMRKQASQIEITNQAAFSWLQLIKVKYGPASSQAAKDELAGLIKNYPKTLAAESARSLLAQRN